MVVKTKKTAKASKMKGSAKKATAKKKTANAYKAAPTKKTVISLIKDPLTKTGMISKLMEATALPRRHVSDVIDGLGMVISASIKRGGSGVFVLPGLMKVMVVRKPATKARKGINPFTGQETMFKAKPARNVVKIRPLKRMKDMAQ